MNSSGYGEDGIYRSQRPPLLLPKKPDLNMVSFLFENVSLYPHKHALIDSSSGEIVSFANLKSMVGNISHGIINLGIRKGDVVMILAPNSIQYPVIFLGILATGAIATTVNPVYTVSEINKQVNDCKPKLVVTVPELWDKVHHLLLPVMLLGVKGEKKPASNTKIVYFTDLVNGYQAELPKVLVKQSDTAALLYSSGTTGASKGVMLSHRNFIAASLITTHDQVLEGERHNVFLCALPMFHVFGLSGILYSQLNMGNAVVLMSKFDFPMMLKAIEKYRVSHLSIVPPIVLALAKNEIVKRYDISSLKQICCGGAPLGKDLMLDCAKNVPNAMIIQGYGMTESCGLVSIEHPKLSSRHSGSTGTLVSDVEAQIIDVETLKPLPPNQQGEVWVRGPNIMKGYFGNAQATELSIDSNGWLRTGDLGYFDEKGQLYLADRLKELIKYNGYQVAPAELESILLSHPEILDAAVIPFPDDKAGEIPIAYVVSSPKVHLNEKHIIKFVADQVAPYKRVRKVTFVKSIPKSTAGKILRRELIQESRSKL